MIVFDYLLTDLLNNAQVLSLYRSNTLLSNGNENVVDDTSISDEDESLLTKLLRVGASEIADILSGYTDNLLDTDGVTTLSPYEFDVTYNSVTHSIVYRVNMPKEFRETNLNGLDESIKDGLENYLLFRINETKGIDFAGYQARYESCLDKIRTIIHRRKTPIKRTYKLF